MSLFSIFMVGLGLSMDAFAVSAARGMTADRKSLLRYASVLAVAFGFFQGLMPFAGWWAGSRFSSVISAFDHWISFILLAFIGIHMIRESFCDEEEQNSDPLSLKTVLILAVATSIDALAAGVSFAFLNVDIIPAVLLIGCTTFVLSFAAVFLGSRLGSHLEKGAGILGGCILIFIGGKILVEHLFL